MGRDADAARLERAVTHGWRPRTKERRTQDAVCRRSLHGRFTECRLLYAATGGRAARLRGSPFTLLNPSTEGVSHGAHRLFGDARAVRRGGVLLVRALLRNGPGIRGGDSATTRCSDAAMGRLVPDASPLGILTCRNASGGRYLRHSVLSNLGRLVCRGQWRNDG